MWDLFYFMEEGLKRNPPEQAQPFSLYTCPVFPTFSGDLIKDMTSAYKSCPGSRLKAS